MTLTLNSAVSVALYANGNRTHPASGSVWTAINPNISTMPVGWFGILSVLMAIVLVAGISGAGRLA